MSVDSVRLRLLLIGPIRLALGTAWLLAARAVGGSTGGTLLAFAAGAFAMALLVPNDPPARVAPAWLHAVHAAMPSTVGVSVLAAVTLAFEPTLTGLLAGILTGLGLVALLGAYGSDARLYLDPRTGSLFRK